MPSDSLCNKWIKALKKAAPKNISGAGFQLARRVIFNDRQIDHIIAGQSPRLCLGEIYLTVRSMTNRGELAILPRKHYEPLAAKAHEAHEDIGTVRLVARARKEIVAGAPLIPKEIVDRIIAGENALRVLREWRGKTQLDISYKTNIGQGYISDLESGRRKGTTAALKKIADVLKVPLDLIV